MRVKPSFRSKSPAVRWAGNDELPSLNDEVERRARRPGEGNASKSDHPISPPYEGGDKREVQPKVEVRLLIGLLVQKTDFLHVNAKRLPTPCRPDMFRFLESRPQAESPAFGSRFVAGYWTAGQERDSWSGPRFETPNILRLRSGACRGDIKPAPEVCGVYGNRGRAGQAEERATHLTASTREGAWHFEESTKQAGRVLRPRQTSRGKRAPSQLGSFFVCHPRMS
jgi:hypothetical protein